MVWKRLIGSDTTDTDGVASVTYTGKGYGLIDVVASVSSDLTGLVSDEKEILDCIFYDEATSNAKASQYSTNTGLVITYGDGGTTITCNESSGTRYYSTKINNNINWRDSNTNYHIEFDYSFADGDEGVSSIIFGNYRVSFSTIHNVATSGSGHLIIESNGDNYTLTKGTFSRTYTMVNNDGFKFTMYKKGVITFKNLKIYPI